MDQVYIPKNRYGFPIGNYVVIKPLEKPPEEKKPEKLYFYRVKEIEPIKLEVIKEVVKIVEKKIEIYGNIIITGSILEMGFNFNDIDVLILTESKINQESVKKEIERKTGIKAHIINLNNKELINGLETDPLYQMMLSKCISKKRFVYKTGHKIDYKLLDLHLLKSRILIDNFDILSGNEKYYLVRNLLAIKLYLEKEKINNELVNKEIKRTLGADITDIKENIIEKKDFLRKYKLIYRQIFAKILKGIENGAKQK